MVESKLNKIGYDLSDINVVQTDLSLIAHRSECNPFVDFEGKKVYPIIVSPMGAVTNENNYKTWLSNHFLCVIPRTVDYEKRVKLCRKTFASFSLSEAIKLCVTDILDEGMEKRYICIDIAHGTMHELYKTCMALKDKYEDGIVIMTGNVANPKAYRTYAKLGIDYMRCFIGNGSRCTTASNVSISYPRATLLDELRMEKEKWIEDYPDYPYTKIIADGGISNFDDIQKCLALGADFVMCGNVFAKAEEACGDIVYLHPDNPNMGDGIPQEEYNKKVDSLQKAIKFHTEDRLKYYSQLEYEQKSLANLLKRRPYREYMGMSTKQMQKATGGSGNTTAEGISRPIAIEYPIAKWAENMDAYLRSAMSYTGSSNIEEFKRYSEIVINYSGDKSYRK